MSDGERSRRLIILETERRAVLEGQALVAHRAKVGYGPGLGGITHLPDGMCARSALLLLLLRAMCAMCAMNAMCECDECDV